MKINRKSNPPRLWDWLADHLPASLVAKDYMVGYGHFCGIYRAGEQPGFMRRLFDGIGDPVAQVRGNEVELNFPEFYADFEDVLRKWERETGIETTLSFWEAERDAAVDSSK